MSDPNDSALPHYERIYLALRADIVERRILGGEKLQEAELARRFNVSRTPIREALHRLEKSGFVTLSPNVGATVVKISAEALRDYADMLVGLESWALERSAPLMSTPEALARLRGWQGDMRQALLDESLPAYEAANEAFHWSFLEACGNRKLIEAVAELRNRLYMTSTEGRFSVMRINHCINMHDRIIAALEAGDVPVAVQVMRAHLGDVCDSMLRNRGF